MVNKKLDLAYQAEMVDYYMNLCAGGSPWVTIELTEECYDLLQEQSQIRSITIREVLRSALHYAINNTPELEGLRDEFYGKKEEGTEGNEAEG